MDYRELPRIVAPDDPGEDDPPRPRRFPLSRPVRLDLRKVATVAMLALSLAAVLFYAGRHAIDSARAWLHAQPRYRLAFDRIELPEPPPDCFRGGTAAFLERVRRNAKEPETLGLLDVDPERLRNAFKSFPWVREVGAIERPPGGLVVHLSYRRPVATVAVAAAAQFVLDREGCILPIEDVDTAKMGRWIWIVGRELTAPPRDREGTIWKTAASDSPHGEALDRGVVQAARLAGFFLDPAREAEAESNPALRVRSITVTDAKLNFSLFVVTVPGVQIHWGRGPGDEAPGEPTAEGKWALLAEQARRGLEQKEERDFWTFSRTGMVYKPYRPATSPGR